VFLSNPPRAVIIQSDKRENHITTDMGDKAKALEAQRQRLFQSALRKAGDQDTTGGSIIAERRYFFLPHWIIGVLIG
jgi:hypothetical protein